MLRILFLFLALPSLVAIAQSGSPTSETPPPIRGGLGSAVLGIFENRCAECHKTKRNLKLHAGINLESLAGNAAVVTRGNSRQSELYTNLMLPADDEAHMPPKDKPQLTADEIKTIGRWIDGDSGSAQGRKFVKLETVISQVEDDLKAQPKGHREFVRYLTLTNLHNARLPGGQWTHSDVQMDVFRAGLSKLLNSISWEGKIVVPQAVDVERTLYRINLRDYRLTKEIWERIVGYYPFGILGVSDRVEKYVAGETNSKRAFLRADWFVFATSQEPLYREILGLPDWEFGPEGFEHKLGVDTYANLRSWKAVRAAFSESGVSRANRLIERHNIEHYTGGYWKSYDFNKDGAGEYQDLAQSALGPVAAGLSKDASHSFRHDGGEMIFHLPNGLQGYYLSNAKGRFLEAAPPAIVEDHSGFRRTSVILNGISCIACHSAGLKAPPKQTLSTIADEIGLQTKDLVAFADQQIIKKLFVPAAELQSLVAEDQLRFSTANNAALAGYSGSVEPVGALYAAFNSDIAPSQLSSEFDVNDEDVVRRLKDSADERLATFAAKLEKGIPLGRDEFIRHFSSAAHAMGFTIAAYKELAYAEFGGAKSFPLAANTPQPDGWLNLRELFRHSKYASYGDYSLGCILSKAQEAFKACGHYKSKVDGLPGLGTSNAISAYQMAKGLSPSRELDEVTLEALALYHERDTPYPKPREKPMAERKTSKSGDESYTLPSSGGVRMVTQPATGGTGNLR